MANRSATSGWPRWKAVSKQATCGRSGRRARIERMGARLFGWCRGASGTRRSSLASTSSSTRTGAAKSGPPWTTRWPTASGGCAQMLHDPVAHDLLGRDEVGCLDLPVGQDGAAMLLGREARPCRPDAVDLSGEAGARSSPATSNSSNLMLELPALRTRMVPVMPSPAASGPGGARRALPRRRRPCGCGHCRHGW